MESNREEYLMDSSRKSSLTSLTATKLEIIDVIQKSIQESEDVDSNSIIEEELSDKSGSYEESESGDEELNTTRFSDAKSNKEEQIDNKKNEDDDQTYIYDEIFDEDPDNGNDDDDDAATITPQFSQIQSGDETSVFEFEFLHEVINRLPNHNPRLNVKKYKNGTRSSLTFTNERMREIERHNQILLKKIIDKGPNSTCIALPQRAVNRTSRKNSASSINSNGSTTSRKSSAALNRKTQQRQINLDNELIKKKLEDINRKRRGQCHSGFKL